MVKTPDASSKVERCLYPSAVDPEPDTELASNSKVSRGILAADLSADNSRCSASDTWNSPMSLNASPGVDEPVLT